jgi:signal transduction histidine kinase
LAQAPMIAHAQVGIFNEMGAAPTVSANVAAHVLARGRATRDEQLTSALRVLIACVGAAFFWFDHAEGASQRPVAYLAFALFVAYSLGLHAQVLRGARRIDIAFSPWVDLGWITLLIAVSDRGSSIFFALGLYLFAILVASFQGAPRSGKAMVVASVLSFSIVGCLTAPDRSPLDLDRAVMRPMYLLLLGYLISRWGGHERQLSSRIALLRQVTTFSNPRFGTDRTLGRLLGALRAFHGADSARLIVREPNGECWSRASTSATKDAGARVVLPPQMARTLLPAPADAAFLFVDSLIGRPLLERAQFSNGEARWERAAATEGDAAATALDARSFVSISFREDREAEARIYLTSRRPRAFGRSDVEFLRHVVDQVAPVLENIRLVDRLASDAAEEERRRIARDIHDSVIQPYIGLRLGLSAVREALAGGRGGDANAHAQRLSELADSEIDSLRRYIRGLSEPLDGDGQLLPRALDRFCARFARATGINVTVATQLFEHLNDRLAAEIFQMIAEGLSNVRKHSVASRAHVRVAAVDGKLSIDIENDGTPDEARRGFSPRSITERAAALGGQVDVQNVSGDRTLLRIDVPL